MITMIFALVSVGSVTSAKEKDDQSPLTKKEISILINDVGLREDELDDFPPSLLRDLIAQDAKRISFEPEFGDIYFQVLM